MASAVGNDHLFAHVADDFVGHDEHRRPVVFAQIEGRDGLVKDFLGRRGRQGDDLIIAVGAPAGLHHVGLGAHGGQAGGRAGALDIDHHAGGFGADPQADIFHHQAETRSGGGGHAFLPGPGGPQNRGHGGDLIFHLDEGAAHIGQPGGHVLGDFGGRRDGIAAEKPAPGRQGALGAGLIAGHVMFTGKNCWFHVFSFQNGLLLLCYQPSAYILVVCSFYRIDGKFRADDFAIVAIDAVIRLKGFRRVVPFLVETGGKGQNAPGAEFDTVAAPFAAVIDDKNISSCNVDNIGIKRNTPEFHFSSLYRFLIRYRPGKQAVSGLDTELFNCCGIQGETPTSKRADYTR